MARKGWVMTPARKAYYASKKKKGGKGSLFPVTGSKKERAKWIAKDKSKKMSIPKGKSSVSAFSKKMNSHMDRAEKLMKAGKTSEAHFIMSGVAAKIAKRKKK